MNDYLTRAEFFEYMGDFKVGLEKRLAALAAKIDAKRDNPGPKEGCSNTKLKDDLIRVLIGALLVLSGVAAGSTWLKGLF